MTSVCSMEPLISGGAVMSDGDTSDSNGNHTGERVGKSKVDSRLRRIAPYGIKR